MLMSPVTYSSVGMNIEINLEITTLPANIYNPIVGKIYFLLLFISSRFKTSLCRMTYSPVLRRKKVERPLAGLPDGHSQLELLNLIGGYYGNCIRFTYTDIDVRC